MAESVVEAEATAEIRLVAGPLVATILDGRLRLACGDVEIVRQIDCPIRDADWRTLPVEETDAGTEESATGFRYHRSFRTIDGNLSGRLAVEARKGPCDATLTARLALTADRATEVNRAGFVLLHPINGIAGTPLEVRHADDSVEQTRFPIRISPGQPVMAIAGLSHRIAGVAVAIAFEGDVFEMEDQRNWSDASFKTYCRPLGRPRPYRLAAGEVVEQSVRVTVSPSQGDSPPLAAPGVATATMPRITLAHDPALCDDVLPAALARLGVDGLLLRLEAGTPALPPLPPELPVTLEIVTDEDPGRGIASVAAACAAAGVAPRRVVALPRGYLSSHQPEGPWPAGPAPIDLLPMVRAAFPGAAAGAGMLTNFTEFNRHPPDPEAIDFATFGTTAIVHAADDRSVLETLETLQQIFESARALVPGRDLHLGLVSIGMRSNPYGVAVADNPGRHRIPMAMDDPRQRTGFAAAWAVGAVAAAARAGVASFAPAMTSGPLGLGGDGAPWPLFEVVAALAALGGSTVTIDGGPCAGLVRVLGPGRDGIAGLAANLGPGPVEVVAPAGTRNHVLGEAAARPAAVTLAAFGVAVFRNAP